MVPQARERRRAFVHWLRTGWVPPARGADGLELKYNPYHDPHSGRFTFGSGGAGIAAGPATRLVAPADGSVTARGGNIRAFEDPMTLEQVFPGLNGAPGGSVFAVADSALDLTGPANEMSAEVLRNTSARLQEQIKAIDPTWHYDSLGPITTVDGLSNEVNDLRFQPAAAIARVKGDYGPLQVETMRFVQRRTDMAYDSGVALQKTGGSENEIVGC